MVPCELEPGEAVFFHANTPLAAPPVDADLLLQTTPWCTTTRLYVPLDKVPDAAVKAAGLRFAPGDEHFTSRPFVPKVA